MMLSVATQSCPLVLPSPKSVRFLPSACLVRGRNLVEIWWTVADIYKAPITPEPWSVFLDVSEYWPDNLVGRWVILFCFAQISHYWVKYPPNWHQPADDSKQHFLTMNTENFSLKNLYFLPKHTRLLHSHPRCFAILCQPTKIRHWMYLRSGNRLPGYLYVYWIFWKTCFFITMVLFVDEP